MYIDKPQWKTWVLGELVLFNQPFEVHKPELIYHYSVNSTLVLIVGLVDEKEQLYLNAIDIIYKTIEMLKE